MDSQQMKIPKRLDGGHLGLLFVGLVILAQIINKYTKFGWGEKGTDEEYGFDRVRQDLEASMARWGWIAPRQLMSDADDNIALSRAETWKSKRRYSL